MSCGVGCRRSSDPALLRLWLWHRPSATALIGPLAWEPPYAVGAALEKTKKKKEYQILSSAPVRPGASSHVTFRATFSVVTCPHLQMGTLSFGELKFAPLVLWQCWELNPGMTDHPRTRGLEQGERAGWRQKQESWVLFLVLPLTRGALLGMSPVHTGLSG